VGTNSPWAHASGFAPADQEPTTHAKVGTGHQARTRNYRSTHISVDLQSGSSLNTCDFASHVATGIVRSSVVLAIEFDVKHKIEAIRGNGLPGASSRAGLS
jgi:hypothetical protein